MGTSSYPAVELRILPAGSARYEEIWALQKKLQTELITGKRNHGVLILCEHNPGVITMGRSAKPANLLVSTNELERLGIELFQIERGGDITYHGPGQLTAYPILPLHHWKRDVGWYLRSLEEVVVRVLSNYNIQASKIEGHTGVWVKNIDSQVDNTPPQEAMTKSAPELYAKISSIGIRLSRWVTLHGLSLNVRNCDEGFRLIHACGYSSLHSTSIEQELAPGEVKSPKMAEIQELFCNEFSSVFNCQLTHSDPLGKNV